MLEICFQCTRPVVDLRIKRRQTHVKSPNIFILINYMHFMYVSTSILEQTTFKEKCGTVKINNISN